MRAPTGISELDAMLHGGLMRGDVTLVVGSAGTGKTTLALQYLINGATKFNENGLYVTFEQMPAQIYRDAASFGWDIRKLEAEGKLRVVCTSPPVLVQFLEQRNPIDAIISEVNAKRIVIDSISHLESFIPASELRGELYRLINHLKMKELTSVFTAESHEVLGDRLVVTGVGLSFLVDCIILLRIVEIESSLRKALTVLKIRGSDHDKQLREFEITSEGIRIGVPFKDLEGLLTGTPRRTGEERFAEAFAKAAGKGR